MEARPCPISEFLNGTKQMLVPLFQRSYEWDVREWEALWDDLLEQYEKQDEELFITHFTGAIVTAPARSVPVGVSKYLVIDGQQRLTTFTIIICAIRSLLQKIRPNFGSRPSSSSTRTMKGSTITNCFPPNLTVTLSKLWSMKVSTKRRDFLLPSIFFVES